MSSIPPPPQESPQYHQQTPFPPPKKSNVGLIVAIVIVAGACLIIPILAAILFPVFSQAKVAAQKTKALKNIKTSATSVVIYAADHDDVFPPDMSDSAALANKMSIYASDMGQSWTILGTPTEANPNLSGTTTTSIKDPNGTIMLYCMPPLLKEKAVVAAADTSAKAVTSSDLILEISGNTYRVPGK